MDEHITREELEQMLRDHPAGQRDKHSDWRGRMERIIAGEPLVLYPEDNKHAHILYVTARAYAKEYDIKIKARKWRDNDQLKLFIWLAG